MKEVLKKALNSDWFWNHFGERLSGRFRRIDMARYGHVRRYLVHQLGTPLYVKDGPFKGMVYPEARSTGSSLIPKILGTYEMELHHFIKSIDPSSIRTLVNIGAAEGYYTVGCTLAFPNCDTISYDIDPDALTLCRKMAAANHVEDRITFRSFCSPDDLQDLSEATNCLVLCDCEGYERELFTSGTCKALRNCHIIVELHDPPDLESGWVADLVSNLKKSHEVQLINYQSDEHRMTLSNSILKFGKDHREREVAFAEHRPTWMTWLTASPT